MQELAIRKFFTLPLPKHHEMLAKSYAIKERVIKASKAIDNDPTLKGIAVAAKFKAPYNRLIAC
jgi:phosphopantetheinyl transferase (holo-ACP synthase)